MFYICCVNVIVMDLLEMIQESSVWVLLQGTIFFLLEALACLKGFLPLLFSYNFFFPSSYIYMWLAELYKVHFYFIFPLFNMFINILQVSTVFITTIQMSV